MKKNLLWYLIAPFILMGVYSCEYSLHENYVEIEPPGEKPVSIDLNAVTDGENLYIYKQTNLDFSLNAFGENIIGAVFKMGTETWEFQDNRGYLNISEYNFPNGIYTLTCELYIKLGDGSVADQAGGGLVGTMSWPVLVNYDTPSLIAGTRVNNDGLLELYWEKPFFTHLEIKSYRVNSQYAGIYGEEIIRDENQTTYVDPYYVGQNKEYAILVELYDKYNHQTFFWNIETLKVEEMFTIKVVSADPDFVEIAWENGVKSHLELYIDKEKIHLEEGQTSLKLPSTGFGSTDWTDQYTIEANLSPLDEPNNILFTKTIVGGCFGQIISSDHWTEYTWNKKDNVLYGRTLEGLYAFSVPDLSLIKELPSGNGHIEKIQSDINSSKIAVYSKGYTVDAKEITIYDGSTLSPLVSIPCSDIRHNWRTEDLFFFTTDNKLVYFASVGDADLKGIVCNVETGVKEKEFTIYSESTISTFGISSDGKYVYSVESFTIRLTELNNYEVVNRKDLSTEWYRFYSFNPLNPNEIITNEGSKLIVRNSKDWSEVKQFSIAPATEVHGIDPLNGNIVATSDKELFVFSTNTGEKLFSALNKSSRLGLLGNTLTSDDRMIFNLDKYIER